MYLIVGAKGFLGSYLIKNILSMTKDDVVAADVNYVETEQNPRLSWQNCDITKEKDVEKLREYLKEKNDIKVIYLPVYFNVNKNPEVDKQAWNVNILSLIRFPPFMVFRQICYTKKTETYHILSMMKLPR